MNGKTRNLILTVMVFLVLVIAVAVLLICKPDTVRVNDDPYGYAAAETDDNGRVVTTVDPAIFIVPDVEPRDDEIVRVSGLIPSIMQDVRYAGNDNPAGFAVYQTKEAYLRYGTVKKLATVQQQLLKRGYSLLIWDSFRPLSAQNDLYMYGDKIASNPLTSENVWSTGSYFGVSLLDSEGHEVPMPSDFGASGSSADRDYAEISPDAAKNARLLEQLMNISGFKTYGTQWWSYADTNEYGIDYDHRFSPEGLSEAEKWYASCSDFINLRKTPEVDGEVVTKIKKDEMFTVLFFRDRFAYVRYGDRFGFVHAAYIEKCDGELSNLKIIKPTEKYSYDQMTADLNALVSAYPDLVSLSSIGKSVQGRTLHLLKVGNPNAKHKILVQASMHAKEHLVTPVLLADVEYMLLNPQKAFNADGKTFGDVLNDCCFWIVPMANPDGVTVVQTGNLPKGFNCDPDEWKANWNGVDLNRNFDAGWKELNTGFGKAGPEGYKGKSAESEPESKALANLVRKENFDLVLSYHTSGSGVYWNYGTDPSNETDKALALRICADSGFEMLAQDSEGSAGLKDYCTENGIPSLTVEFCSGNAPHMLRDFVNAFERGKYLLAICAQYMTDNK